MSAVWAGETRDLHFKGPPLLFGETEGSTPFQFSLHVGDVGHTLVVGPTVPAVGPARADGPAISPLPELSGLCIRFRWFDPGGPRSPWMATGMIWVAHCPTGTKTPSP